MSNLELKVPPVVVVAIVAAVMWVICRLVPSLGFLLPGRLYVVVALVIAGVALAITGVVEFRRAHTTVNPMAPDSSTSIVECGVYSITRNPMYLGMLAVVLAWCAYLSNPLALLGPPLFVLYMTRFQIIPEELALTQRFGSKYTEYTSRVRRWL